jgi:hypothetical protein
LSRVRLGIKAFYELNETLPRSFKIPLTREQFIIYCLMCLYVLFLIHRLTTHF